jgi:glycosyltransferase involved in cell wall biosynthesis
MKIAFVSTIFNYPWGGADTLWTHAAEAAAARGDKLLLAISALVVPHPRIRALVQDGAQLFERPAPWGLSRFSQRLLTRIKQAISDTEPLIKALQRFRPDLVIVSCGGSYCLADEQALGDWLLASKTPFRAILNWQAENPELSGERRTRVLRLFDAAYHLYAVSTRNLAITRRHLLRSLENANVIQNPLRGTGDKALSWPSVSSPVQLATIGRFEAVKGVDLLLHALADTLVANEGWTLSLFGQGPQEAYLREVVAYRGLSSKVVFRGYEPDLEKIWSSHHLLISPSIDDGVPMTIPEAMLRGRPVLATRVGGADDWIADGATGFICPAATVPLLGAALQRAWSARTTWPELGRQANLTARERYLPTDFHRLIAPP